MSLSEVIHAGLDNPDCAFFTGYLLGGIGVVKIAIMILGIFILYKAVDKLAITPILDWIKQKIWRLQK